MAKPVTLRKIGNATVVGIPRHMIDKLLWRRGDVLQVSIRGNALLVQRMQPPEPLVSVPDERRDKAAL
jgi:antitoxin component of MazEF toxin-antitoxin module